MKASGVGLALAAATACLFLSMIAQAQTKGARSYFPKNNPAPPPQGAQPASPGARSQPGAPAAGNPGASSNAAAKPQLPKFKDLPVNSQFYFLADTNHSFAWMKISSSTASNTQNAIVRPINGEIPIQK